MIITQIFSISFILFIINHPMQKDLKEHKYTYHEDDLLGEGSFGKVYKGKNNHTQKLVALKQIELAKLEKGEDMLKQILLSQISVMRKFNKKMQQDPCPFLVRQEDVFRTDKHIFIVMEICLGGTLEDEIRAKRFKQKECIEVLYCLCKGLEYMGDMGITHRDLKPQNIFISSTKVGQGEGKDKIIYKIGDFGFAAQKQQFDIAMGTFPYMAPEMFKKQKYTNKVDVWSLGVIAYQIMFGGLYFVGKDKFQIKKNILQKPLVLSQREKSKASVNYQDFLARTLNKQPKYRIGSDQLLNHPLFYQIQKELANMQAIVYSNIRQEPETNKINLQSKAQEQKIFEEVAIQPNTIPTTQEQTELNKKPEPTSIHMVAFSKVFRLLEECFKMRVLAEKFHTLQESTNRKTEFIQLYLLKDSYAMMNRLTYTVVQKQNHIQLDEQQFSALLSPECSPIFTQLQDRCLKECNWVTGLFNQKYKWFQSTYIHKFEQQDQELMKKVVNQAPYEYVNGQVFEKQLRKWQYAIIEDQESGQNKYTEWKQIGSECRRILQMKLKG